MFTLNDTERPTPIKWGSGSVSVLLNIILLYPLKLCSVSISVSTPLDNYKQFAETNYCPYVDEGIQNTLELYFITFLMSFILLFSNYSYMYFGSPLNLWKIILYVSSLWLLKMYAKTSLLLPANIVIFYQ